MKRLLQACAEEIFATTLAAAMTIVVFVCGWFTHATYDNQTDGAACRAAEVRVNHARAEYYENINRETQRREDARRPPRIE